MTEATQPIDLSNVPNNSKKSLNPIEYAKGLSEEPALNRLLYRLNFIELNFEKKKQVLREGNIANLEAEILQQICITQDLIDVCREMASLTYVSINQIRNFFISSFQQEQGVAPPPNA